MAKGRMQYSHDTDSVHNCPWDIQACFGSAAEVLSTIQNALVVRLAVIWLCEKKIHP